MQHDPLWMPDLTVLPRLGLPTERRVRLSPTRVLDVDDLRTETMVDLYRRRVDIAEPEVLVYVERATGFLVMASVDPTARFGGLLHLSMSYPKHDPTWTEIKLVKQAFFGSLRDAIMVLPAERDYVNEHEHCFHLSEAPERWGMR